MSEVIDVCPACGEQSLVAVCQVVVEYTITNDGEGGQDWERSGSDAIDDDSSDVVCIRCESCGGEWNYCDGTVHMESGHLVGLGWAGDRDQTPPIGGLEASPQIEVRSR
jgi:hypothetical protein